MRKYIGTLCSDRSIKTLNIKHSIRMFTFRSKLRCDPLEQGCPTFLTAGLYKFQTSRGSDDRAPRSRCRRHQGGREWRGGVPSPADSGVWRSVVSSPSQLPQPGPGWSPGRKQVLAYFRAWKNTPDRHKSIIFWHFCSIYSQPIKHNKTKSNFC